MLPASASSISAGWVNRKSPSTQGTAMLAKRTTVRLPVPPGLVGPCPTEARGVCVMCRCVTTENCMYVRTENQGGRPSLHRDQTHERNGFFGLATFSIRRTVCTYVDVWHNPPPANPEPLTDKAISFLSEDSKHRGLARYAGSPSSEWADLLSTIICYRWAHGLTGPGFLRSLSVHQA